jgi:hypothetical protein
MASPFSKPSSQTVPHSDAKPIPSTSHPTAHKSVAEQQHESHEHINADLYRTFSPSDVAMWDWKAGTYCYRPAVCTVSGVPGLYNVFTAAAVHSELRRVGVALASVLAPSDAFLCLLHPLLQSGSAPGLRTAA